MISVLAVVLVVVVLSIIGGGVAPLGTPRHETTPLYTYTPATTPTPTTVYTPAPGTPATVSRRVSIDYREVFNKSRFTVWAWIYDSGSPDVREIIDLYGDAIDYVSPVWYFLDENYTLGLYTRRGAEDPGFLDYIARKERILLAPTVASSNASRVKALITDRALIERFIDSLVEKASRYNYSGYNIDFEVSLPEYSREYAEFIERVSERLHEHGLIVTVAVPAMRRPYETGYLGTYRYELLDKTGVDGIMIMAYDYYEGSGPKPVAPLWWVEDVVRYVLSSIDRRRVFLGVPNYGKLWSSDGRLLKWLLYSDYMSMSREGALFYTDNSVKEKVYNSTGAVAYYVDGELAYYRARLALAYGLRGVAVWRLDNSDPVLWRLLRDLRQVFSRTAPPDYPLAKWTQAYEGNFRESSRTTIRWIVVHVAEGTTASVVSWFRNPSARVSAHYIVGLDGSVVQMVREKDIAWHAGNRLYNELSIGIEHEGWVSRGVFTEVQYMASARLSAYLALKYGISVSRPTGIAPPSPYEGSGIIGHDQVPDPNNPSIGGGASHHTDPGQYWRWDIYMDLVKRYYNSLRERLYEKAFIAAWWGFYSDRWSSDRDTWTRQVDEALERLQRAGVKAVFILAKDPWGYVYYNSSYAPLSPKYSWDLLRDVIELARRRGIEVYVYINVLSEGEDKPDWYLQQNPDEALRSLDGRVLGWVDPACERYRERVIGIISEILRNYPEVRGIQLDRIRAPSADVYGRCSEEKFYREYNKTRLEDPTGYRSFLVRQITELVREISLYVKRARPDIPVSAAVFPSTRADLQVLQDWVDWVNQGYIDYVVTMTYTDDFGRFRSLVDQQIRSVRDPGRLFIGIGAYRLNESQLVSQLSYVIELAGLRGAVLFNVDSLLDKGLVETLYAYRTSYLDV